ncbi:MAG: Xaa-Pro peptidase family protein [Desulfobacterales bacterium]|jgi:Xaa-Pro aminopeptidase
MTLSTPPSEIETRINHLKQRLEKAEIDAALILQNSDLFYFTGTIQQAHLFVPVDGEPLLMVRKDIARAAAESPLRKIVPISRSRDLPELLRGNGHALPRRLGLELDVLPANLYLGYRDIFSGAEISDVSTVVRLIRAVKSDHEIGLITVAAGYSDQVADSVREYLREGITEIELAGLIEARARRLGHQGIIRMRLWGSELFYGHLMAGPAAAVPSYLASPTGGAALSPAVAQGPGFRPIQRREPILFDYVFANQGYLSDHTRIFAIEGLPDELLQAHQAMLAVQSMVKKEAKPGVRTSDVYDMAVAMATELGYADNFMGVGDRRIRFIGHGIGIELDEYPFLAQGQRLEFQQNMIVALEPKLIFPGVGVVGIENTHVVTADGLHQLGKFNEEVNIV